MKNIKWGIIGTGRIARTFASALRKTENAVLYAVASRSQEKAESFAREYGFSKAYGNYSSLAQDKNIDIVYIATPMASHFGDVMTCLEYGKNILCEKSVTLNSEQLEKILAKSKDNFFMEAMWTKCRPVFLKAKEWVNSGKIGDIKYIKADFSNHVEYNPNDRLFRADCGGGALLDLTVYPLTLAQAFLGEPDEIISSAKLNNDNIDLSDSVMLKYRNGCFASINSGFEMNLKNNAIISGTDGYIIFGDNFFCTCDIELHNNDGIEKFHCENIVNGYEYEITEAQRCISENLTESPLVPHSDTLSVMKIMDECRKQWGMKFPDEQ